MPAVLLKVEEAAELLRVGRTTVYALIKSGELASVPVGRLRRIRPADLAAYADSLRSTSTPDLPAAA
jgi:excisionase family DNA binding protein